MENMATWHLLARLAPDIQARLRAILHVRIFAAGEQLFPQGGPAPAFYIVASGRVKVVRVTAEGYALILCVPGPGDCFCPVPVLDEGTQLGSAVALTDATLLWAESGEFRALCEKSPELLSAVQGICLGEVRRLISRFESLASRRLTERLAGTMLAESRHRQIDGFPPDELHLTHQELAELVGAARESVSRLLTQWAQKGVVTLKRGLVIVRNRDELQRLAGE